MNINSNLKLLSILIAMHAASHSNIASADEQNAGMLEEVIVVAQRREQSLQDVPLSVTALEGQLLKDTRITSATDLVNLAPSLTLQDAGSARESSFNIRGIGTQSFSSGVEPSVSTVVDGVVMGRSGMAFSQLFDIQRVEVLRGPQGTLFGKNASAGVVNIITRSPGDEFEASLGTQLDDEFYRVQGMLSLPINDALGLRLAAMSSDTDGHIRNLHDNSSLNDQRNHAVRAKLNWQATDALTVQINADYAKNDGNCCQFTARQSSDVAVPFFGEQQAQLAPVSAGPDNLDVNVGADVFSRSESYGASIEINWLFEAFTLTSITAQRRWDIHNNIDVDGTAAAYLDTNEGLTEQEQLSQELRITSPGENALRYVVGLFYFNQSLDRHFDRQLYLSPPDPAANQNGFGFAASMQADAETNNYAASAGRYALHQRRIGFQFRTHGISDTRRSIDPATTPLQQGTQR